MAIGQRATRDLFYTPGQRTGAYDWTQTPVIGGANGYYEQNPDTYWTRYINQRQGVGLNDTSPYAQYVRNQYANAQRGFQASIAEDPTLTWQRYLNELSANFATQFQGQTYAQRGENPMRVGGPARIIADLG